MQPLTKLNIIIFAIAMLTAPGASFGGQVDAKQDQTSRFGLVFILAGHTAKIDDKCHVLSSDERRKVDRTLAELTWSDKLGVLKQPLLNGMSQYKARCADMDWVHDWRAYAKTGYLREK